MHPEQVGDDVDLVDRDFLHAALTVVGSKSVRRADVERGTARAGRSGYRRNDPA